MRYQKAGQTSTQEHDCSKAHALLAITGMEGMEIRQERETKKFYWPLFNYRLEGFMFSNIKLITLCILHAKKTVMCEFTTTSKLQLKLSTVSVFCKKKYEVLYPEHRWSQFEIQVEFGGFLANAKCRNVCEM